MKSDTERKRFYNSKNHQKTKRMNVHLSKGLRASIKKKKRSLLVRKGDRVRVMRGPGKGSEGKVLRASHAKMKVYVEGMVLRTAKGREVLQALQPSNLMLVSLEQTKERKELFSDAAFKKPEAKPKSAVKVEKSTIEAEVVPEPKEKAEAPKEAEPEAPKAGPVIPEPVASEVKK